MLNLGNKPTAFSSSHLKSSCNEKASKVFTLISSYNEGTGEVKCHTTPAFRDLPNSTKIHPAKTELPPWEKQNSNCTFCKAPNATKVPRSIFISRTDILSKITKKIRNAEEKQTNKQSPKKCNKFPRPRRRATAGGGGHAAPRPFVGRAARGPRPPAAAARLGSSRPRSQQVPRRARGEGRARRRRACSLLAWRRGARRRRPAGASCSRALPRALSAPPLTRGVHASARARPGQRARRGPGGLAPAALGRGACAREGGGAGTVSRGRCAAGWLPAWARLRGEAAHWATRVPRASSIPSACTGAVVALGAPVPGQGHWARGWESPAAPGDGRLMGVVDEARHAGGEELPLAPRSSGGLCGFYPAAQSSQNTKTSCLPPRPSPATENLFR
nr:uncharacterized protein LOC129488787 [Symphalangus syndactylus]